MKSNYYSRYESVLSLAMLEQALINPVIKSILVEIATKLKRDVLPEIMEIALSSELSDFSPALPGMFNGLAMQHSAGDKFVGALLPDLTQNILSQLTKDGNYS